MTIENRQEKDNSLDGTLADFLISGKHKKIREIFPRRRDRLQAYGRIIAPIIRHPIRATLAGFEDDKGRQITSEFTKNFIEWTLDGNRCAPEFRAHLEASLGE